MLLERAIRRLVMLLACCGAAADLFAAELTSTNRLRELRSAVEILQLSQTDADLHYPVHLQGVVTFVDPSWELSFVQDDTAGVYAYQLLKSGPITRGERLDIRGTTAAGKYSPILTVEKVERSDSAQLPAPRRISVSELDSGRFDSQYVEIEGVVEGQEQLEDRLRLEIAAGSNRCRAWVLRAKKTSGIGLLDTKVHVRGVAGAQFGVGGELLGFQIYVDGMQDITLLEKAPADPFAGPVRPADDLSRYISLNSCDHRVHVQGVVTALWPGHLMFIQDSTGGIYIEVSQAPELKAGQAVEAAGFLVPGSDAPKLRAAEVRRFTGSCNPAPIQVARWAELATGQHNFALVQTEVGLLATQRTAPDLGCLVLETLTGSGKALLLGTNAMKFFSSLTPGSRLRITGVCQRFETPLQVAPEIVLWLRSTADVQILSVPRSRAESIALWTSGLLGLAIVGAGLPISWYRRRARRQSELNLSDSRRELRHALEERERISKDLHDNIMQSIYAVGLGLEDCRRIALKAPPQAEERLSIAIRALNGVIQDIRQFIGGLEPKVLSGSELKTALKSLALTAGDSTSHFVIQVDPIAARQLTPKQATHLLNIAKEAISNTLRHAKASRTTVALGLNENLLRLEIADDGNGFDTQAPPHRGNGLVNMSGRAREMGAQLRIVSAPSSGTRVLVDLPLIPSHDTPAV